MRKTKIAFVSLGIFYGGATRSLQNLVKSIDRNKYEIHFLTRTSGVKQIETDIKRYVDYYKVINISFIYYNQVSYDS